MKSHQSTRKSLRKVLSRNLGRKLSACVLAGLAGLAVPTASVFAQPRVVATAPAVPRIAAPTPSAVAPELAGKTIEEVRVVGNVSVSTAIIRNLIRTREGDKLDPATVVEDYQRVYGLKKFAQVLPKVEPTATGVIVIFEVVEQRVLGSIQFRGNASVDGATLRNQVDVKSGESIDPFRIAVAKQAIRTAYKDRNFPFTRVDIDQAELDKTGAVTFVIVEGPHVRIRKMQVLGNKSFTEDKLLGQVKSGSWFLFINPGRFDIEQLEDDVASLRQYYQQKGFFDARVDRKLSWSPDQSEVMVSFVVDEGVRYVVDRVTFKNNHAVPEAKLREGLKLVEGRAYDSDLVKRDVRAIVRTYSPFGYIYLPQTSNPDYLNVETKTVFRKEPGKIELIYEVSEGKAFRVGRVLVKGNSKVQQKVFLREMRVTPGQLYNSAELQDAADRLRGTQLVSGVNITPIGDDPNFRDVLVEIKEGQTAFFTIGAGFTSNAGVLGNISYEQKNFDISNVPSSMGELFSTRAFTGAGQYFRIQLEPGTEQSRASVTFNEPYILDQPYSLGSNLYYSTRTREHYDEVREGGRLSLGHRFDTDWTARVNFRGEIIGIGHFDNKPLRAPEILAGTGHHALSSVGIDVRRDTVDNFLLPSKGSTLSFSWEHAGAFGGDYNFDKLTLDGSYHQTISEDLLDRKTIMNYRASVAYITPDAPFFERLYGGGQGSIRGFRYRGISPRGGLDRDPVGGDFSISGTVELNFPLAGEVLRGVVFTDGGTVNSKVAIGTFRASVGAGLRITLPFLGQVPIALDFAIPVVKDKTDNTQFISFSLGAGF